MKQVFQAIYKILTHEYFLYAIVFATCIGTYYARAAVSITTGALGVIAILTALQPLKRKAMLKDKSLVALTAVFLIFLCSGLISSNTSVWLESVVKNMTYLAIPAGIWAFGPFGRKTLAHLVLIFVVVTASSGLMVMLDYTSHFNEYNELYKFGKTIPTPVIHVRFSYFLALASVCCAGLLMDRQVLSKPVKFLTAGLGLFLAICTHILAVRTGLFALYGGFMTLALMLVIRERKWLLGISVIIIMVLASIASVKFLPSVSNKLGYVLHDINMFTKQLSPEYSDNVRFVSIRHGINIFRENPLFGVGVGDIKDATEAKYESETPSVPEDRRFPPISQYVYWLASLGIVGTILIIGLLIYPLLKHGKQSYLLWGIYALTGFSLFAETTLQLQLGKTIFLLLVVIVLQWSRIRLGVGEDNDTLGSTISA